MKKYTYRYEKLKKWYQHVHKFALNWLSVVKVNAKDKLTDIIS